MKDKILNPENLKKIDCIYLVEARSDTPTHATMAIKKWFGVPRGEDKRLWESQKITVNCK